MDFKDLSNEQFVVQLENALKLFERTHLEQSEIRALLNGSLDRLKEKAVVEQPVLPEPAPDFPEMNEDLLLILGKICFQCAPIARVLRLGGMEIKTRAENEQAHVIHWLLKYYLKDPVKWMELAGDELKAIQAKVNPS